MIAKKTERWLESSRLWLEQSALPLWAGAGSDALGFVEGLKLDGTPVNLPRRCLVQARQIYVFRAAVELGLGDMNLHKTLVRRGTESLLQHYSLPSGAFLHSVNSQGQAVETKSELYTQAFALFGLANAYALFPEEGYRLRALTLLEYLRRERRGAHGGFTEISPTGNTFLSNPHMHLFEAALYWMQVDASPAWRELADELLHLCRRHFIQADTGILGEKFREDWSLTEAYFEPGHHYEWSWLMGVYEELTGENVLETRMHLFSLAETYGLCPDRRVAYDEVDANFRPRKKTSRYWPQCERAKAALRLEPREKYLPAADEAIASLFRFLDTPTPGLSWDVMLADGSFGPELPRASCLYHVVNALQEYLTYRP